MEQNRKRILLFAVAGIVQELIDSSSESDDEDLQIIERNINIRKNVRRRVPRIENYVEEIVAALTEEEFKAHFRYLLILMHFLNKEKLQYHVSAKIEMYILHLKYYKILVLVKKERKNSNLIKYMCVMHDLGCLLKPVITCYLVLS